VAGLRVVRAGVSEITALGAAYLAGLATGFWRSADEVDGQWKVGRVFEPERNDGQLRERWKEGVARVRS